jgi:hypothetical protein
MEATSNPSARNDLLVAAHLAAAMTNLPHWMITKEVGVPVWRLDRMIELTIPFNRNVLRFLGFRRTENGFIKSERSRADEMVDELRERWMGNV